MKMMWVISLIFFLIGLFTLPHYGINWDTINHLPRGQAYLHFFLTGRKDYSDLPQFERYWQHPESLFIDTTKDLNAISKRSLYQHESLPYYYLVRNDGDGHPPISDILSSLFNVIFFQNLKIINDVDSYRIYGIFLATCLVGLIFWWISRIYGKLAGVIGAIALSTYPLFWSESHFNNEKDIPETVFWSFMLFCIWKGVTCKNWRWIILSGLFFGLAFGTKLNIVFSVFIVFPWLVFYYLSQTLPKKSLIDAININKKIIFSLLLVPIIGVILILVMWPYLWTDPIAGLGKMLGFYKSIGFSTNNDYHYLTIYGINTYPIKAIIYSTPLVTLFLSFIGIFVSIFKLKKEKNKLTLLFLLWLIIPIIRVTWPGTTTYGGIRQIMEYIPAIAIFAGIGSLTLKDFLIEKLHLKSYLVLIFLVIAFLPITLKLISIHPNENVFFNPLIGGLVGAKAKQFPAWGNSFGSAYRQGVVWINQNAEPNAKIAFARELLPNIPIIWLRSDLNLHNSYRSGSLLQGEYIIGLNYQGVESTSYFDRYLARLLNPIHTVEVDGVPILKIWRNSSAYLKPEYKTEIKLDEFSITKVSNRLRFDFGKVIFLSQISAEFDRKNCSELKNAYVQISQNSLDWEKLPGNMPKEDWSVPKMGDQPMENSFLIPFAADQARYVDIVIEPEDACLKLVKNVNVKYFIK